LHAADPRDSLDFGRSHCRAQGVELLFGAPICEHVSRTEHLRGVNDPRRSTGVSRALGEAISDAHRRNRGWAREHPDQRDEAWFKREVAPMLDGYSLSQIAKATGLSLAACSRIRAGARVPHPRHWDRLLALVEAGN
jgi:hypothetical protein